MEKDLCRGVVYFTVLCDHPYLVSLLFAVLVSLHPVTFFITCNYITRHNFLYTRSVTRGNRTPGSRDATGSNSLGGPGVVTVRDSSFQLS